MARRVVERSEYVTQLATVVEPSRPSVVQGLRRVPVSGEY